jgi:hypothetical protein
LTRSKPVGPIHQPKSLPHNTLTLNYQAFFVDVQDVALIHVAALLDPDVKDARLQTWGHKAHWNDFLPILRELRPQRKFIPDYPETFYLKLSTDQSESVALLKKWAGQDGWKPLRQIIAEAINNPCWKTE